MDAYEILRAQIEAHIETHGAEEARLRAEIDDLRAHVEVAEARAAQAEAEVERLRALLSTGLEIVDSLSAGYDVWAEQVRAEVEPGLPDSAKPRPVDADRGQSRPCAEACPQCITP